MMNPFVSKFLLKKKKIIKRKEFLSKKLLEKIFNSNNDPTNIS